MTQWEKFARDMEDFGIKVFYDKDNRPYVMTSRYWPGLQEVMRSTDIRVQWEQSGKVEKVYPLGAGDVMYRQTLVRK